MTRKKFAGLALLFIAANEKFASAEVDYTWTNTLRKSCKALLKVAEEFGVIDEPDDPP